MCFNASKINLILLFPHCLPPVLHQKWIAPWYPSILLLMTAVHTDICNYQAWATCGDSPSPPTRMEEEHSWYHTSVSSCWWADHYTLWNWPWDNSVVQVGSCPHIHNDLKGILWFFLKLLINSLCKLNENHKLTLTINVISRDIFSVESLIQRTSITQ